MLRTITSLLVAAALSGIVAAQCNTVTASLAGGNGQNGTMFDIANVSATPITISAFEQVFGVTANVTVEIYTKVGTWSGSESTPAAWTLVGSSPVAAVLGPTLTPIPLAVNVTVPAGATQGFYITTTNSTCTYTTGVNQINTVIGSDANINVLAGPGKVYPFAGSFGLPTAGRLWNGRVIYSAGGPCVKATNTVLGVGCGTQQYNSAYQLFADAAVASTALQGNALQLINTGTGYAGVWVPGGAAALFVAPVAPTTLVTGDDGEVNVTPSIALPTPFGPQATLRVTGNAIIGFGGVAQTFPGTNAYTPTAAGFLDSNNGGFYAWHDYNEAEGGDVQSEEIGGVLYITYNNVESYSTPVAVNPSTLQFQLDLASGNCTIVWVTVDTNTTSTFGSGHLVGVTGPGLSGNPGSIDLATATIQTTAEVPLLTLSGANTPIQGAGPQNWNLTTSVLPVGIGVDIIGLADPGIVDLSLFGLGQPGCQLRATLDVTGAFLSGGVHAWSFPIPGGAPSLSGIELFAQTAILDFFINLSQTQTTNGLKGTIGNF